MRKLLFLFSFLFCFTVSFAQKYWVSTFAGDTAGYRNGANDSALFNGPAGIAVDTLGNVYVADYYNNRIRKISGGVVSTFAGDTAGFRDSTGGTLALFNYPIGICTDDSGNVYVADTYNNAIRKISPAGIVTTIGGKGIDSSGYRNGPAANALFSFPVGVAVDRSGNIYVADNGNNRVRVINTFGVVSTLAGDGNPGYFNGLDTSAEFNGLGGIAVDDSGAVYVSEYGNNAIRKIKNGYVTKFAGYDTNGIDTTVFTTAPGYNDTIGGRAADSSLFNNPTGLVVDDSGNVFVCDEYNYVIREVHKGRVYTFAGSSDTLSIAGYVNGISDSSEFYNPIGIALDKYGNFYVSDNGNNVIREISQTPNAGIEPVIPGKVSMQVYPVPCNDKLIIANSPSGTAQLLDLTGRVVWSDEHFKAPYTLTTGNISPGVYFIKVSDTAQSAITKIVIEH
ncbi:MAG: T9SS type A sorting domain-containing protein [Bacteroidia bacterium]